jgi:hypothetical protein
MLTKDQITKSKEGYGIVGFFLVLPFIFLDGLTFWLGWNWFVPEIFAAAPPLRYLEATCIICLISWATSSPATLSQTMHINARLCEDVDEARTVTIGVWLEAIFANLFMIFWFFLLHLMI